MKSIYLPAVSRRVTLASYVETVKYAKANPEVIFRHGLDGWWPITGAELFQEFRRSINHRINQQRPYLERVTA